MALPANESFQTPAINLDQGEDWTARPSARKPLRYGLDASELSCYAEQGFLVKRGLLANLAEELDRQADRLLELSGICVKENLRFDFTGGENPQVWKIDPFVDLDRFWSQLARDRRIADALASIYEGREPRLMKDKLIYKPPHSHGNGLHHDYTWWQGLPKSAISVCIAVDRTTGENGATTFYPGLHRDGLLHPEGELTMLKRETVSGVEPVMVCAEPGDVVFFGGFTPHEAGSNRTDGFRRQIFLSYNDSADGEWRAAHYDHFFNYRIRGKSDEERERLFFQ